MRARCAIALLATALLIGCGGDGNRVAAPQTLHGDAPAPDFALRNANGRVVRLSQFRGRVVLLTFVYSRCPDVCPLIVEKLKTAQTQLGRRGHRVQIVAVSVDPRGDTPRAVRAFLRAHRMTGRMEYLLGSRRELARVWRRYGIAVFATPEEREVGHSGGVVGITARGRRRAQYPPAFRPAWIVHDVPALAAR
ncbi:MAG: SCO family protein [Actinomycetota bacterium]|nr:SCO family protein [Actinomycetota bacterium]